MILLTSSVAEGDVTSSATQGTEQAIGFWQDLWDQIVHFFTVDGINVALRILVALLVLIAGVYLIKLACHLIRKSLSKERKIKHKGKEEIKKLDSSVVNFIITSLKFFLTIVLALLVIYLLGIPLDGMTSILSSAFLAVGLGLQDIITNFANGVIILSESNIKTGDYVTVDGVEGTITKISMMRTTLTTPDGRTVLVPNTKMSSEIVTDNSVEEYRRQVLFFTFHSGIDVDEMLATIEEIGRSISKIVENDSMKVAASVYDFSQTRQNCITLRVFLYMRNVDYWDVYSESQKVYYKEFQKRGIKLADYDKEIYIPK